MGSVATISLFCYLTSLALALTVWGGKLMYLRWFALCALLIASGLYWISPRQHKLYRWDKHDNMLVTVYLIATFLSVIAAENPLFSGLRWLSHASMIVSILVFLRNKLTVKNAMAALFFLKIVIAALLLISWLRPVSPVVLTFSVLYQGAFGSSNALGQIAAIGAILYLHGYLTDRSCWLRLSQIAIFGLGVALVWLSGSRSAMVAFLSGLALMHYFYPKLIRGKIFLAMLLVTLMAIALPTLPGDVRQVIFRSDESAQDWSENLLSTRKEVLESAWAGFQKRPLLGWGFGADDSISRKWEVELTALGTVGRDYVNDTVIVLESCGIVGLCAYMLLVLVTLRQMPTRRERHWLGLVDGPPLRATEFALYHFHAITFVCASALFVMVQFDNTALSAGNFVSVTLWVCVTLTSVAHRRVMAGEFSYHRQNQRAGHYPPGHPESPWLTAQQARARQTL